MVGGGAKRSRFRSCDRSSVSRRAPPRVGQRKATRVFAERTIGKISPKRDWQIRHEGPATKR